MNAKKKRKDPKEVLKHTTTKTLENGAYSYGVASSSSLLGSAMQNSANKVIQNLGNGLVPTMVVGVGVGSCEVLIKYFSVTVSTLSSLSAFLKVPIIDKDQKLQENAQRALEIMKRQMDSLESGRYNVAMIQSKQKDLENL
ncbi:hypothetical protein Taiwan47_07320 [Helicobacter pylori]|uniref:hypothetical protein n=1 Tax=Helicobacter pylori TaxID=210 RepID=UPI000AF51220|nr:hypothetical protein [Helicobacter pylori]